MIELRMSGTRQEPHDGHQAGCMICGQELIYAETSLRRACSICGKAVVSSMSCPDGHFVCDECHRRDAVGLMEALALNSKEENPLALARELMALSSVHLHGPEHHVLVPVVLLASLRNLGVKVPDKGIAEALSRAKQLPGGICGTWGTCGAAIGAGIGLSVLRHLTALKTEGWAETNRETGEILQRVGAFGGPRCCKRSTYSALLAAVEILERDGVVKFPIQAHETPVCRDFWRNRQCLKEECAYYPGRDKKIFDL